MATWLDKEYLRPPWSLLYPIITSTFLFPLLFCRKEKQKEKNQRTRKQLVWLVTMAAETSTQSYSEKWYWDDRYTNESDPFDWYQNYPSLSPLINLYVPHRTHRALVIGCGNSGTQFKFHFLFSDPIFLISIGVESNLPLQRSARGWWMTGTEM